MLAHRPGVAASLVDSRRVVLVSRDLVASVADQMNRSRALLRDAALVAAACRSQQLLARTLLLDRQQQPAAQHALATAGRPSGAAPVGDVAAAAEDRSRRFSMPDGAEACAVARRVVTSSLRAWGVHDGQWIAAAEVVVSELVSNAVRHGGGCRWIELHLDRFGLTLQVADESATRPQPRTAYPHAPDGRGLALIDTMTDGWHTAEHDGGKRVWATLRPPPLPTTASSAIAAATGS